VGVHSSVHQPKVGPGLARSKYAGDPDYTLEKVNNLRYFVIGGSIGGWSVTRFHPRLAAHTDGRFHTQPKLKKMQREKSIIAKREV